VKSKIYAISLLLSFLVALSHEMIAHHHHDELALSFSVRHEHDEDYGHKHPHEGEHQQNHDSKKKERGKERNHPFPFHQHLSATNDIYLKRTNQSESKTQIRSLSFLVHTELYRVKFPEPPYREVKLYKEPPFLISSFCNLEAFALRGPPYIA